MGSTSTTWEAEMADGKPAAGDAPKSGFFKSAKKKAAAILKSPDDLKGFLGDVEARLERDDKGRLRELVVDVKTLVRLVRAYVKGEYRDLSSETLVLIVAALLYLVNPLDLIPDMLPAGFVDDAAVIGFVISMVRDELEGFRRWEGGDDGGSSVSAKV